MSTGLANTEDQHSAVALIREELARRRMSRAELAAQAKISLSSLEKALSGQRAFTEQILVRIEDALKLKLRTRSAAPTGIAPEWLGSYARAAVQWIEGEYLTLRPASGEPDAVYAYRTGIAWDDGQSLLAFHESDRLDGAYAQAGTVSIPHQTGHVYLLTSKHGQYRLAILSRPTIANEMFGVLTTLQTGRGSQLMPVATVLALLPMASLKEKPALGRVSPGSAGHAFYKSILARATGEDFARLLMPPV